MRRPIPGKTYILSLFAVALCATCRGAPTGTPSAAPPSATSPQTAATDASVAPAPTPAAEATSVPATATAPRSIRVVKTSPVTSVASNEEYDFSNCGGNQPLSQPFSDIVQVSAEVVIAEAATRSDGTLIAIDEGKRVELAREVELAYEPELTAARTVVEQTKMEAAPFTRWGLIIVWEDRVFAATVSYPADGATASAAYTSTLHVPGIAYYKTMPCTA